MLDNLSGAVKSPNLRTESPCGSRFRFRIHKHHTFPELAPTLLEPAFRKLA